MTSLRPLAMTFSALAMTFLWAAPAVAQNQLNLTTTQNQRLGVAVPDGVVTQECGPSSNPTLNTCTITNDSVRTSSIPENTGGFNTSEFTNSSDTFEENHDCSTAANPLFEPCKASALPKTGAGQPVVPDSFRPVNTQFGSGVPCGFDDPNRPELTGKVSPYPCTSEGTVSNTIAAGIVGRSEGATGIVVEGGIRLLPPTLGGQGKPFFRLDSFSPEPGIRVNHIEYGFDQSENPPDDPTDFLANCPKPCARMKHWFVIDTIVASDGKLLSASGTFKFAMQDEHATNGCDISTGSDGVSTVVKNIGKTEGSFVVQSTPFGSAVQVGPDVFVQCTTKDGSVCASPLFEPGLFNDDPDTVWNTLCPP